VKILVVGNGFTRGERPGGFYVNHHTAHFLIALAAEGHEVTLAQPVVEQPSAAGLNNALLPPGKVQVLDLNKRSPTALLRALGAASSADFVYIFYPGTWPHLLGRVCRWLGKGYGLYVRGEQFGDGQGVRALFADAKIICAGTGLALRIEPNNPHVTTVSPMLDMTEADAAPRDFNGVAHRPLRVLFVGRLERDKGVPELVEAIGMLKSRGFPCEARLVGGGPLHSELERLLGEPGSPDIALAGLIADKSLLVQHYEWADVLVLPSHHEGFPRVLYEGMLKSCVIVTTMVGGIPALMKDDLNCKALPLENVEAIADTLQGLPRDPAAMQSLADAGRETVLEVLRSRPTQISALRKVLNA